MLEFVVAQGPTQRGHQCVMAGVVDLEAHRARVAANRPCRTQEAGGFSVNAGARGECGEALERVSNDYVCRRFRCAHRVLGVARLVNRIRLLSPETVGLIFQEQANGIDLVLGMPARWGIGVALPLPEAVPDIPDGRICYWGGWGGSMAVMDTDRRTTFSYVKKKMGQVTPAGTERTRKCTRLIYQAL